jgi:hypothetical protein
MADRPCKPDADFKRLWRAMLPGTPFPACGMPPDADAASRQSIEAPKNPHQDAETRSR